MTMKSYNEKYITGLANARHTQKSEKQTTANYYLTQLTLLTNLL